MNCAECKEVIDRLELLFCSGCKGSYHYKCLNITPTTFKENNVQLKRTVKCELCMNVTRRVRVSDDTPVRRGSWAGRPSEQLQENPDQVAAAARGELAAQLAAQQADEASTVRSDGKFDVSVIVDMISETMAAKFNNLETRLVRDIKAAIASLSTQETDRLRTELKEANDKCARYQAEIESLRKELKSHSNTKRNGTRNEHKVTTEPPAERSQRAEAAALECAGQAAAEPAALQVRPAAPSYAAVARKPEGNSRVEIRNAHESEHIGRNNNDESWMEVKSKKMHPIKKGGNINSIPIKAVERKKYLHIWRLHKETTVDSLKNYIQSILGDSSDIKVDKIVHKTERGYSSFRVSVSESDFEKLNNSDIWPKDAEYSEWTWFRGPTKKPQT